VKRNYTATNSGLKHNWITALAPAPQGGWLVGTYGAGIQTLSADGNRFSPIDLPAGAPHDLVINPNALLVTRTHVYAGTLGHGMLVFDIAAGRWAIVDKGLPSLNVTAFAERDGTLYIGTENGLVRIPEAKLP
jgi:ligand-binding sensor domain-containing protein